MQTQIETRQTVDWPSQVVIRHLLREDLPTLEWGGEFTHFRRVYAEAFERMQQGQTRIWIAEQPNTHLLLGQVFVQLMCDRPELADGRTRAYLYSFRVREGYRSRGLGSYIMETVENEIRQQGFSSMTLNVAKENQRARQLYLRRGYHIVAHEAGIWSYPDDKGIIRHVEEPAWRMEKDLLKK
jgi:ribosomal protein S18 acetylase RimI-like enzyme